MAISGMRGLYIVYTGKGKSFKGAGNRKLNLPLLFGSKRNAKKADKIFRNTRTRRRNKSAIERLSIGYGTIVR